MIYTVFKIFKLFHKCMYHTYLYCINITQVFAILTITFITAELSKQNRFIPPRKSPNFT